MSLLELHLEKPAYKRVETAARDDSDGSRPAAAERSSSTEPDEPSSTDADESTRERSSRRPSKVTLILVLLAVGAAIAIRRRRS